MEWNRPIYSDESIIETGDSMSINRIEKKPFSNIDIESKENLKKIDIERKTNTDMESNGIDIDPTLPSGPWFIFIFLSRF